MPALVFAENQHEDPVPAVPRPMQLAAERAGDKLRYAQRQAIDLHLRLRLAVLIVPDRGFEGWQM
jgi:hypothetical protein